MPRSKTGLDKYIYCLLDNYIPFFCKKNIHPNYITILNIINASYIFYNLKYSKNNKTFVYIQIILYYIFDCLDGEIARQCNKQSKLGGYLDSTSDLLFTSIIFTYLICKFLLQKNYNYFDIYYIVVFYILFTIISIYNIDLKTHECKNSYSTYIHNNLPAIYLITIFLINKN